MTERSSALRPHGQEALKELEPWAAVAAEAEAEEALLDQAGPEASVRRVTEEQEDRRREETRERVEVAVAVAARQGALSRARRAALGPLGTSK